MNKPIIAVAAIGLIGLGTGVAFYTLAPAAEQQPVKERPDHTAGSVSAPAGLGNILTAGGGRLLLLDGATGETIREFPELGNNSLIKSISCSADGLFAADRNNGLVYRFLLEGRLLSIIGSDSPDGILVPGPYFSVSSAGDGTIWLSNPGNHKVERYDLNGNYLGEIDIAAHNGPVGCCNPVSILALEDGTLVVGEKGIFRVRRFDSDGRLLEVLAGDGGTPLGFLPLELTAEGNILSIRDGADVLKIEMKVTRK